ncbi:MAG: MarR family transcriptional regulator [Gemmatimonadaceae bacterium]|nr:MarR family transcriptional regulator [Gemmatimonadaceae bacterium]
MDYINSLGVLVLDHRFRRIMETLLQTAAEIYTARGLSFRPRWASTYRLLAEHGSLSVTELATLLKLSHPAVIGITHDMAEAGLVTAMSDRGDARRRLLTLTVRGRKMNAELNAIWTELARVQKSRFRYAGCDIVPVLDHVELGIAERSIAADVLAALAGRRRRKARATRRKATVAMLACVHVLTTAACAPATTAAATSTSVPAAVYDAVALDVVNAVADSLVNEYIYEPVAHKVADSIRAEVRRGAFGRIADTVAFVSALNASLLRLTNDRHLGVRHPVAAQSAAPVRVRRAPGDSAPASATPRRIRRPTFGTGSDDQLFARARVLDGNVGYMDLRGFPEEPAAVAVIDSLMGVVANVKGLIIDLGNNRGGGPSIVRHLSAYLFDKPVHLVSTFQRGMTAPRERWTVEQVPGKRLPKIPVILLTSRRTISAPESFAFGLKANGRVTVIGERTGGGGHFGRVIQLPAGFSMFLPTGRTFDPRSNKGWESTGIKPDLEVEYDRALEVALNRLRQSSDRE